MIFFSRKWKLFYALLAVGLVATALLMFTLAEIHQEILRPRLIYLDLRIQNAVHRRATPGLTRLMFALSRIGSPDVLAPIVPIAAALLWWRRLRNAAVVLLLSMAGAGLLTIALKLHFRRVRPEVPWALAHEPSFSFPSGHSVFAVVLYGTLVFLGIRHLPRTWQRVAVVLAALALIFGIGYSRIYLGVHYPSDVAAGYFVGAVWVLAVAASDWYVRHTRPAR